VFTKNCELAARTNSARGMAALSKYFVGVAVILPAVMVLSTITMSEIFVRFAAVTQATATQAPRWNTERLKAELDTPYIAHGSLSPIYPATPGKGLLGKPIYTASVKRIDVRQPLQLHKLPRQLYAGAEQDSNYPQQSLSYIETRPMQLRTPINFGHGIY
jgi:hypothetical protein